MAEDKLAEGERSEDGDALEAVPPEYLALAAYLGHPAAQRRLGAAAPALASLESIRNGGDRLWRKAMHALGHEPAAMAACGIAELAFSAYMAGADAPGKVETLAREAASALRAWKRDPASPSRRAAVAAHAGEFCLAVDVGGRLSQESGFRARSLGRIVGHCYSVVLAPENRRHIRWLGGAAEEACHQLGVPEATVWEAIAAALRPYALAPRS